MLRSIFKTKNLNEYNFKLLNNKKNKQKFKCKNKMFKLKFKKKRSKNKHQDDQDIDTNQKGIERLAPTD